MKAKIINELVSRGMMPEYADIVAIEILKIFAADMERHRINKAESCHMQLVQYLQKFYLENGIRPPQAENNDFTTFEDLETDGAGNCFSDADPGL